MSKKICRAFTLYHDKVFVNTSNDDLGKKLNKDYVVIGYFDWFKTESWIMDDDSFSLTKLFEYNNKINAEGTSLQSFQNVFGFREDNENTPFSDEEFWDNKNDDCFQFILYLQVADYHSDLFNKIEQILHNKLNYDSFILYYTLDKNDLVICFKSLFYSKIVDVINYLYDTMIKSGNIIIYSYTNFMIKYSLINSQSFNMTKLANTKEMIDSICIKTILNNFYFKNHTIRQKVDYFCKDLAKELYNDYNNRLNIKDIVGYEILGDNDCRFIARHVPMNRLLSLFSENGLLNKQNSLFKHIFISSMTSLNVDTLLDDTCFLLNNNININNIVQLTERSRIDELGRKLHQYTTDNYDHLITLLYQIYDYICFIGYQPSKYEFFSLKQPFELLLSLIEKAIIDDQDKLLQTSNELYEYLSVMYTSIQENMRTDIRFYGLSDFSMMSYYSPTKLRIFYFSVINSISEYYRNMSIQDKQIQYQFFIFFTNTTNTNVKQLWKDKFDEDKIMMVRISEKDFYEVNNLIFQLAHEAAHFVGNEEIRKREFRFYQCVNYLMTRVYEYIRDWIEEEYKLAHFDIALNRTPFSKFLEINQLIIQKRINYFIKQQIKNEVIYESKFFFYTDNVKLFIKDVLYEDNFMINFITEYFNSIFEEIKMDLMDMFGQQKINIKKIKEIVSGIKEIQKNLTDNINSYKYNLFYKESSVLKFGLSLVYESYADMSAVLLFNLNVESFCNIIEKMLNISAISSYFNDILFIRMCIVIKAFQNLSSNYSSIVDNSFVNFLDKCPQKWNDEKKSWYENIKKMCEILEDKERPLFYLYQYILKCLEAQCDNLIEDDSSKRNREKLNDIYNQTKGHDLLKTVIYINNFIANLGKDGLE